MRRYHPLAGILGHREKLGVARGGGLRIALEADGVEDGSQWYGLVAREHIHELVVGELHGVVREAVGIGRHCLLLLVLFGVELLGFQAVLVLFLFHVIDRRGKVGVRHLR